MVIHGGARRGLVRWQRLARADRRNLVVLALAAVTVRLVLILAYSPLLTNDSYSYLGLAHQIASNHLGASSGTRTPGYPLVLIALRYSPLATWCVQAVLGVLATLLVYGLARRLGAGTTVALAAGLVYALDLEVLAVEHIVLTETLTSFLLLVAAHLGLTVLDGERPRGVWLAVLGVAFAYLCLVRPDQLAVALYLVVALSIVLSARIPGGARGRLLGAARPALWLLVPPVAVLVAWAGVNRATIGVTSVSTVLGFNMIDHVGAQVRAQPGPDYAITSAYLAARRRSRSKINVSYSALPAMERASHLSAPRLSGRLLSIAAGVIERHPFAYLASSIKQWPRFWVPPNYAYEFATGRARGPLRLIWKLERVVLILINVLFVLLLLGDLALRARRRTPVMGAWSLFLAGVAVVGLMPATFLAYGETGRYGYVYSPLVLCVTAAAARMAWQRAGAPAPPLRRRSHPSRA